MYIIAIYYNPNKDSYYYRKYYYGVYSKYEVGYKNSYGHEIILIIDLMGNEKISFRKRIIDKMIRFLKNIR